MSKIRKGVMVDDVFYGLIPYEEIEDLIKEGMSICDICDLCLANGYLDNLAPCSTCEGRYCEYAQYDFAEENDIEIIDL